MIQKTKFYTVFSLRCISQYYRLKFENHMQPTAHGLKTKSIII
jgi:hypothetical protein